MTATLTIVCLRSSVSNHWQAITDAIPDGRVSHDVPDSVLVNWNSLLGGARRRPRDGHWIVVVHDIIDGDLDTAPELDTVVSDRTAIPAQLLALGERLLEMRRRGQSVQ